MSERSPSAAKERAEQVAALIRKMMALPNDPGSRREMKAAGREALELLDPVAADRLPDPGRDHFWRDTADPRDEDRPAPPPPVSAAVSPASHCGHDPAGFVTAGEGAAHCPSCEEAAVSPAEPPERYYGPQPADPVWVRFECGHRAFIERAEYGDGSAMCGGCGEIQTYARCLTCGSLDCQSREGPTVGHV